MGRHHTAFDPFWQSQRVGFPSGAKNIKNTCQTTGAALQFSAA
jgi:hypothetical protein